MGRVDYLAMKTDQIPAELINSDFQELGFVAKKLANDVMMLGGLAFGTAFLQWTAFLAATYLLVLEQTRLKSEILTSLLVPYMFLTLPSVAFIFLRGWYGRWLCLISVLLQLFVKRLYPGGLDKNGAFLLLVVVAPDFVANTVRNGLAGNVICLLIACYLLQENIRISGGFKNSFTTINGISNSIGILLLMVYPIWAFVLHLI